MKGVDYSKDCSGVVLERYHPSEEPRISNLMSASELCNFSSHRAIGYRLQSFGRV